MFKKPVKSRGPFGIGLASPSGYEELTSAFGLSYLSISRGAQRMGDPDAGLVGL